MAGYVLFNALGEAMAGDPVMDQLMKDEAKRINGWIEDDRGRVVYDPENS